ncbi:hypothetical protein Tco_1223121, partial [Tanacetum coccineum]
YQAHIKVEWCNQFGSIKYLFKYITKGPDRVTATVEDEEKDEIKDYLDCRYLSSCEAAWRIFKFDIHHRFPAVERLPFQLEKPSANTSKLLNHVRGAEEWEDFRTYDDVVYPTCKDACFARGLLDDDKEPEIVWEKTWHLLAEDVLELERRKQNHPGLQLFDAQRYNICLTYIEDKLLTKGPRPRYPRVWKTKPIIGTVSKSLKLVECASINVHVNFNGLSNVKEEGALDSFIAWDLEFPLITVKKGLKSMERDKEWPEKNHSGDQVDAKKRPRKNIAKLLYVAICFGREDGRFDETEELWTKLFSDSLESMPRISLIE